MSDASSDHDSFASLAAELVHTLSSYTHQKLDTEIPRLGEAVGADIEVADDNHHKKDRVQHAFAQLTAEHYPAVLRYFLDRGLPASQRNQAEDLLWAREDWPTITERTRREIAEALESAAPIWSDADGLWNLLRRLWILESDVSFFGGPGPADLIERHVFRNPEDWTVLDLFKHLGAQSASDRRFALFVQGLISGAVNPSEDRQRALVETITPTLATAGLKIVETSSTGGFPDFTITPTGARSVPAQLIVFASTATDKPDLRLSSVLEGQIEVLTARDDLLVYDQPVGDSGLTWEALQDWWASRHGLAPEAAKLSLWQRLIAALPAESPPQEAFFRKFYDVCTQRGYAVPALLPEVWHHWDPISKARRGQRAYASQRMDFLVLLPVHRRIVIEIDGAQHYSHQGEASPKAYAETMRADRELRLSGYEVYRFGGYELTGGRAPATVAAFVDRLLTPSH